LIVDFVKMEGVDRDGRTGKKKKRK